MIRLPRFHPSLLVLLAVVMNHPSGACIDKATTQVAIPVQIVTPTDIRQSEPFCGRALLDLIKIAPAPALNINKGEIKVPASANTPSLLDDIQIRSADGSLQPATGPICFENIEVLKQPVTFLYGDGVAGTVNVLTKSPSPAPKLTTLPGAASGFFTPPLYLPGEIQAIRGPFDGKGPGTSVDVGGKSGLILAETPRSLYWILPPETPHGSISITVRDAGQGATFPVFVLGLAMGADRLKLLKGESTRMQATVFGPELMPEEAWKAGDVSDLIDLGKVAQQFPDFKIPKPGEPGKLFFRVDNASRDVVSMSPAKNESFVVNLDRGNFTGGPYTYAASIHSKRAGGFAINGLVVAFFAPITGKPLAPGMATEAPPPTTPPSAPPPSPQASGGTTVAKTTEYSLGSTSPCPKKGDPCAELRRRWEQLEQEATAARLSDMAASDQLFQSSEAAALEQSAANDRAFAAKLREQAAAYRQLAENNRADAAKNHQRAAQWPAGHEYRRGWEAQAAQDEARAAQYDGEAQHLEAEAAAVEARAGEKAKRAGDLRQGVDPSKVSDLEAKTKAAAEARAAYDACLERVSKECPAEPGRYSLSLGLSYTWPRPEIALGPTTTTRTGTGVPTETPSVPPGVTSSQPKSSDSSPPACTYRILDGWFAPSQGVWQDDLSFDDRPGKQLTRVDVPDRVSYIAELPMIRERDTVVTGVHHYVRGGKRVEVDSRFEIVLNGETNCTQFDTVQFKFSIQGPGQGATTFVLPEVSDARLHGPPQQLMQPFRVTAFSLTGLPKESTFRFASAGPYTILAEVIKTDGSRTGLEMRVSGNVLQTTGPTVHFIPVALTSGKSDNALEDKARTLAVDAARFLPDLYPLAPGGLPTQAQALKDFTAEDVPGLWEFGILYRREPKMVALLQDHLGTAAFLTGAGRVVAVLHDSDYQGVSGTTSAGKTLSPPIRIPERGLALSYKVILVKETSDLSTSGHELVHTLPGLWSSGGMKAECGKSYHNEDTDWAHGLRLVVGGRAGQRRSKDHNSPLMGPAWPSGEDLANPFTGGGFSERMTKNPETGKEENKYFIEQWITQCTYRHLAAVLTQPPDPPMLLVRGFLGRHEGKYGAYLNAFYDLMGHEDLPQDFMGDFAIVLKDSGGSTLATYRFAPDWSLPGQPFTRDLTAFGFRMPLLPGLAQIDLTGPQGQLDSRKLSAQPPKVKITSPPEQGSATPREGRTLITWAGSGEAGKNMLYTVLYSSDDGKNWEERVFEKTATSAEIQLSPQSTKHAVKVIVTDGSRSAEAMSHFTAP